MPPQTEPDSMRLFAGVGNEMPHRSQLRDKHTMTVQSRSARRTARHGRRHLLLRASCPAVRGSVTDSAEQRLPRIRVTLAVRSGAGLSAVSGRTGERRCSGLVVTVRWGVGGAAGGA